MNASTWTRSSIREFVRGQQVRAFTVTGQDLPVPEWLHDVIGGTNPSGLDESLAMAHPDDRADLVKTYLEFAKKPGEISETRCRYKVDGVWIWRILRVVNLLAQPDVGAMLSTTADDGPVDVDEVDDQSRRVGDDDAMRWMQVQLDPLGHVLDVKGKSYEITGRTPSEMTGQRLTDFLHPDALAASVTMWFSLISEGPGATRSSRRCYLHPDGTELWVESAYLNRLEEDGAGFVSMFAYDITERRLQEEALRQRTEEVARLAEASRLLAEESRLLAEDFRLLADEVPAAVFRCDDEGRVTFSNTRWAELLGAGIDITSLHETVHPDEAAKLTAELASVVADGSSAPRSFELRAFDHVRIFAFRCRSISDDDPSRRRIVGSIEDVTATVRLRSEARHDALTGALNRTVIERAVSTALLGDAGRMLVVFLDLDGFKEVNDLHGHHAGDVVLKAVAARLASAVRPGDLVGRYGGDEFVVVCQSVGTDDALLLVRRLEEALGGPVCFPGGHWQAAASIGTARPQPGDDLGSVLRRADQAMFDQKRHRRRTTAS